MTHGTRSLRGRSSEAVSVANDLRYLGLAAVALSTAVNPVTSLRVGAIAALILALPDVRDFRPRVADVSVGCFAFLYLISVFWATDLRLTFSVATNQVATAILFVALRISLVNRRAFGAIGAGYLLGCGVALVLLFRENPAARVAATFDSLQSHALDGINANYTAYAMAAGMVVVVLIWRFVPGTFGVAVLCAGICTAGVMITGSRGGVIGLVLALSCWLFHRLLPAGTRYLVYALVVVLGVGILTGLSDAIFRRQFRPGVRETGDLNGRLSLWPQARQVLFDHPLIGLGAGSFPILNDRGVFAHDVLLDVGVGTGIVGILVYCWMMWAVVAKSTSQLAPNTRLLIAGVTIGAMAPALLTGYWYQASATWVVLALVSRCTSLPAAGSTNPAMIGKKQRQLVPTRRRW